MYYPSVASNGTSILVPIFVNVTELSIITPPVSVPWGSWEIVWSLATDVNPEKVVVFFSPRGIEVGDPPEGFKILTNEMVSKTQWRLTVENSASATSILSFNVYYQVGEVIYQHDPTILVVNDPVSPNLVKVKA
jgi:hypothetical protein